MSKIFYRIKLHQKAKSQLLALDRTKRVITAAALLDLKYKGYHGNIGLLTHDYVYHCVVTGVSIIVLYMDGDKIIVPSIIRRHQTH